MSAPDPAAQALPRSFGRYALFDFIGKGGMAEIYLARQKTELGASRLCVVKQILPALAGDAKFSEMLVHEAKLAARLNHANVVQVFDLGREDGRLYIAMEYVEGFDLNDLLRRCSRAKVAMPFELGVHVVSEALRGLDYAHRRSDDEGRPLGLVHRDVSPSNLLVSFAGEVKVCDFGIARANDALAATSTQHELDEAIRGKAGYMSPEHARGQPIDARADVFAAGVVLWELAAGHRMYRPDAAGNDLLEQARRGPSPELPAHGLPEPDRLQAIVRRALAIDSADRYASAVSMLRDLEEYAMSARLRTSPLQMGDWLERQFGEQIVLQRRARERAAAALERGAPLVMRPVVEPPPPSTPPPALPSLASVSSAPTLETTAIAPVSNRAPAPLSAAAPLAPPAPEARSPLLLVLAATAAVLACTVAALAWALAHR